MLSMLVLLMPVVTVAGCYCCRLLLLPVVTVAGCDHQPTVTDADVAGIKGVRTTGDSVRSSGA